MTGYTVHTGSTEKFSEGWDRIFSNSSEGKHQAKATEAKTASSAGKKSRSGKTSKAKKST